MLVNVKFKEPTLKKLLKNMIVIVDTREKDDKPIIKYFESKKIPYIRRKLEFGDYSCMLKKDEELGLLQDVTLENVIAIECKNSLEEISNNLTKKRNEFENEFIRAKFSGANIHLIIEKGSWEDINNHNYNTQYNEKSFYNSLISFQRKYDLKIYFVNDKLSGLHILRLLQAELKKYLNE